MKAVGLALASFIVVSPAIAASLNADSKITDVTVYPDRAQVTRTAEVPLVAGENQIGFTNLPGTLLIESVRASGKAAAPVTIQDVEVRSIMHEEITDALAREWEERRQKLQDESTALEARQRVVDQERYLVQQIQIKAAGDISRDVQINKFDVAQLKELPATVGGELMRLEDEAQKIAVARRELKPRIDAVEAEIAKRRTAASRAATTVNITVTAKEATKLRLQVSYVLAGASWVPTYDARAATDAGHVEFTYNGIVRQQTGEDWRGVNLALSTARPAMGAKMPGLEKWSVDFVRPIVATATALGGGEDFVRMGEAAKQIEVKQLFSDAGVPFAIAQIEQGITSATFRVPRAADVPSDGEPHRQTIAVQSLPASFRYETAPKLMQAAYLKALATNSTDAPFIAGAVNVFVGADFIGTGKIETVAPTEPVNLYLGTDDAIRVKREELKERRGKSGLFNHRQRQVSGYKITLENFKDQPQHVVVFEQIPVPGNEAIKVALTDASTRPTETEAGKGKLMWDVTLKPRQKREIIFEFCVEWPQGREVSGL